MPTVSIIMNCRNCEHYLKEAIDSVYAQTFPDFEIIFWDNNSSDNSALIAGRYDNRLHYYKSPVYQPLGMARNHALHKAQGKYIAFLDCDDIWLPEKLEKQIHTIQKTGHLFIHTNHYNIDMTREQEPWIQFSETQPEGDIIPRILTHYHIGMLTVMLSRDEIVKMDRWFDESLNFVEEYDFFIRYLVTNQAGYIHEPLAIYRLHASNISRTSPMMGEMERVMAGFIERGIITNENYAIFCMEMAKRSFCRKEWISFLHFADNIRKTDKKMFIHLSQLIIMATLKIRPVYDE